MAESNGQTVLEEFLAPYLFDFQIETILDMSLEQIAVQVSDLLGVTKIS